MEALDTYPKTGHAVLMGRAMREWQDTNYILTLFGQKTFLARRAYRSFVAKGIALGKRPDLTGGGLIRSAGGWTAVKEMKNKGLRVASDERVLGSSDFVRSVLRKANKGYNKRMQTKGLNLDSLITFVADQCGADETLIKSAVKQRIASQARAIVVHLAIDRLRISGADLSRKLNLTPSAVSRLASRGRTDPLAETIDNALWTPKRRGGG
jgi:hypothetical protein